MFRSILYICNEYPPAKHGGIGVVTKTLAENLAFQGKQVIVLGYDDAVGQDRTFRENGVTVFRLRKPVLFKNGLFPTSVLNDLYQRCLLSHRMITLVKQMDIELVESYDWSGPLLMKSRRAPLVVRMHGSSSPARALAGLRTGRLVRFFEKRNLRMADFLCSVSHYVAQQNTSYFNLRRPVTVIPNGVDVNKFYPATEVPIEEKLGYIGRVHPLKGLKELFLLLNHFFRINARFTVEIAGNRNAVYEEYLFGLIPREQAHRVRFRGPLPHEELNRFINSCTAMIIPAPHESFGMSIAESMACGKVVFSSDWSSVPEIMINMENGVILDFNRPAEAAKVADQVLRESGNLQQISKKAAHAARERFSLPAILSINGAYYDECLSKR